ncbi:hypothetical protein AURDEDRAFT_157889 [Auricularia subglabra TFB-10046 SS5]|nr:hypothetical protein AURDEDRAFT_157889 [Auricularia subglabra TFB-10046 SS5]
MRKNSRWASYQHMPASRNASLAQTMGIRRAGPASDGARRTTDHQEVELIATFEELKREIKESHERASAAPASGHDTNLTRHHPPALDKWPVSRILAPFLELIRSPLSTGPITTAAITSLHNLLVPGLLHPDSDGIVQELTYLSHVVSHCKFETSDTSSDEIVLSKITSLVTEAIRSPLGSLFGDTEICEMLETVLTTSCHTRLSELLRRLTQTNLHTIIRVMFTRPKSLEPDVEEQKLRQEKLDDENSMAINAETGTVSDSSKTPVEERLQLPDEATVKENLAALAQPVEEKPAPAVVADSAPYGLPAVIELFRAIIDLLDPNSQKHTDSARLVALRALNVSVEVAGRTLQTFPSLLALVVDNGRRYLFQLARSNNPYILFASLRTISALFDTMREHLKLQQELFLSFCIERLAPPPAPPAVTGWSQFSSPAAQQKRKGAPGSSASSVSSASGSPLLGAEEIDRPTTPAARPGVAPAKGETRDLMLDTLLLTAQEPSFMVDLWVNYDSDVNCEDLFERFVTFLSRSVYPAPSAQGGETRQQPSQFQCLETLLTFIGHMTARANGAYEEWRAAFQSSDVLKSHKSSKRLLIMGASKFNVKPKDGLAFLAQHHLLGPLGENGAPTRENVAKFLKCSPRLDKKLLGDYISRSENRDLLVAYIKLFDFHGVGRTPQAGVTAPS